MGMLIGDDDPYIGGLFEVLNQLFARLPDAPPGTNDVAMNPPEGQLGLQLSGVLEMQAVQAEFKLFDVNRPLVQSLRALGVGERWNRDLKRKWYMLIQRLDGYNSNYAGLSGGKAIADALAKHLATQNPDPVYFKAHDSRTDGADVRITPKDRPVFYMEQDFLTISIPMKPKTAAKSTP